MKWTYNRGKIVKLFVLAARTQPQVMTVSLQPEDLILYRSEEHKQMKRDGYDPLLTHARWALLKRPENLTPKQEIKLKDIMKYNLKSIRAYFLKEQFQQLWRYVSPLWAGKSIEIALYHSLGKLPEMSHPKLHPVTLWNFILASRCLHEK